jgi:hypothetical protein
VRLKPAVITPGIHPVTGPAMLLRSLHHIRTHRIQLDGPDAGQKIALRLDQAGTVPPLPEGTGTPVFPVDVLR